MFRCSFVSCDQGAVVWPDWFLSKYRSSIAFKPSGAGQIASLAHGKHYGVWLDLADDVQKAIDWRAYEGLFVIVFLFECDGVSRCLIWKDRIEWTEPRGWRAVPYPSHESNDGCSSL